MRTLIALVLLTPALVLAQTPMKVGYQGRLLNADGTAAQGTVQMRFDFFAASAGGASLWNETQTLALSDGLYSTFLGEVTALPSSVFDGSERFLEITIGTVALSPRQKVASVPYALVARDPRLLVSCADGEVLKWATAQGQWSCAADDGTSASTLANYATIASLSNYVTTASLANANYLTAADLTGYATTASLSGYVTNTGLAMSLSSYATTLDLASYATNASLTTTLAGYVTTSNLSSTLASYATTASIPTSVNGMTGGTISSSVNVTGTLAATLISQNGNTVCDVSGNCGATLGSFNPATNCTQDQVLRWTGTTWSCATVGGSTPTQPCTGAGQALQWDGSNWACINLQNSGLSQGQANGTEVRDDWGDVWDGVPRSARTWAEANQACISDGARLPTVTELWRNRASYGTGNLSGPNENFYLWTIAPSYRPNYYAIAYLSNSTFSEGAATSLYPFRCIWKSQSPAGLSGNRCFGPPGAECRAKDAFYNVDRWSRAPQYYPSARKECELENGALATAEDLEAEISRGANFVSTPDLGWPTWHWTASGSHYSNGYDYLRVLRWTRNPEPWWGPDASSGNIAGPSSLYPFRCVGKKSPLSGFRAPAPACQGGSCFEITTPARNRLIADNVDRAAATWHLAFKDCLSLGATLPSAEEFGQLVGAGWGNGVNTRYLWSGSPATWGWQVYRWTGTGTVFWNTHHDYGTNEYTGTLGAPNSPRPYRCVWRETESATFTSCPANQVQLKDPSTGVSSCVTSVAGNPNGQQNPVNLPPFVDAWGNAFDLFERSSANFTTARATCEGLGGRLPLATELYRVRYQQAVVSTELGQSSNTSYLWTLNPDYRETYRTQLRLSDGSATSSLETATAPYRCVWPSSQPTAFSGHACYGDPSAPCFETGRLRADRYPRASLQQPAAQWECRQLGGRLPSMREYAELQQASLPNSVAGPGEWSREWAYWSDGATYVFLALRGTNPTRANWQFDSSLGEASWNGESALQRFRCVYSDVME